MRLIGQLSALDTAEVLSAPEHLACVAAVALGWEGVVLPPMVLLGRRVVAVAELIGEVHERRISSGWGPVTDRVSVSMWGWPEMSHLVPAPAVALRGVIAPARHWRIGLVGVAPFVGLCPTAVLLPADVARDGGCLSDAEYYGLTVLAAAGPRDVDPGGVDVVHVGRRRPVATTSSSLAVASRWVHELVYDWLLMVSGDGAGHSWYRSSDGSR